MRTLLSETEIQDALRELPGWAVEGLELVKAFRFPSYLDGIRFVNALAQEAEAMNHHPDLIVGWRVVTVRLSTHSAKGLTALDVTLAKVADRQCR